MVVGLLLWIKAAFDDKIQTEKLIIPCSSMVPACRQAGSGSLYNFLVDKYFVYAIRSSVDNRIYIGMSTDPDKRLQEHNRGETKSTKGYRPWALIYEKLIGSRVDARKEEKRLKSGYIKERLKLNIPL